MNWQFIRAIAEKDLYEVAKNRIAISGAIVLSVIFAVGLAASYHPDPCPHNRKQPAVF